MKQKFNVLYTARNEGHINNNLDEATAIFVKLLQLGEITAQQYKQAFNLSCLKNRNARNIATIIDSIESSVFEATITIESIHENSSILRKYQLNKLNKILTDIIKRV